MVKKVEEKLVVPVAAAEPIVAEVTEERPQAERKAYLYGVGGRKTAISQVRLYKNGSGTISINKKTLEAYFPYFEHQMIVRSPLERVGQADKLDVSARVKGGGPHAQAEAVRHGLSLALTKLNQNFRKNLKKVSFLTRDARVKERKKPGLLGARRAPQFSKR